MTNPDDVLNKMSYFLPFQHWFYILSGIGYRTFRNFFRCSLCNHGSAFVTAFRTDIDDVICGLYHIQIVLDHNDCIPIFCQSVENLCQLMHIGKMQSRRRLVQNIDCLSRTSLTQLCCQLDTLGFSAGQSRRRLSRRI